MSFQDTINSYCHTHFQDIVTEITDEHQIEQLSWIQATDKKNETPQSIISSAPTELSFEVQRALWRYFYYQTLKRGDYAAFVRRQSDPITQDEFKLLQQEFIALSSDAQACIEATAFIVISDTAKKTFKDLTGTAPPEDSEQFLTKISQQPERPWMPILNSLNPAQRALLGDCYLQDSHIRHMTFSEGGNAMYATIATASPTEFSLWKWRWLINLCGFNATKPYYDQDVHHTVTLVLETIAQAKTAKDPAPSGALFAPRPLSIVEDYLQRYQSEHPILCNEPPDSFLTHLVCFMNMMKLTKNNFPYFMRAYNKFKSDPNRADYLERYQQFLKTNKKTPTYTPALLNTPYATLTNASDDLAVQGKALEKATYYCCEILYHGYAYCNERPDEIISFQDAARPAFLNEWQEGPLSVTLERNKICVALVAPNEAPTPAAARP